MPGLTGATLRSYDIPYLLRGRNGIPRSPKKEEKAGADTGAGITGRSHLKRPTKVVLPRE